MWMMMVINVDDDDDVDDNGDIDDNDGYEEDGDDKNDDDVDDEDDGDDDDEDDGDGDGDGDDDDDDDIDDDGERKMMMLRRRMLRRKTDPKTGKRTLCEPEQSKCRRTLRKSHFVWKITVSKHRFARACAGEITRAILHRNLQEKRPGTPPGHRFVRACAVEMHKDMSQEAFCRKFTGKMLDASDYNLD